MKCRKCDDEISKGKVCMSCVNNAIVTQSEIIEKINWNLGTIATALKEIATALKIK